MDHILDYNRRIIFIPYEISLGLKHLDIKASDFADDLYGTISKLSEVDKSIINGLMDDMESFLGTSTSPYTSDEPISNTDVSKGNIESILFDIQYGDTNIVIINETIDTMTDLSESLFRPVAKDIVKHFKADGFDEIDPRLIAKATDA